MKRTLILALSALASMASAQSFNPDAYLGANPDVRAAGMTAYQHINLIGAEELKIRLAATKALEAKANSANDVKYMFCDCVAFWEFAIIQDAAHWYVGSQDGKTTTKELTAQGWRIQNAFSINAKQYFIVFVK